MMLNYPFTEEEYDAAVEKWGCNCGPSALAFALQIKLDVAGEAIPGFHEKRYTSPTMMKAALAYLDAPYIGLKQPEAHHICHERPALVRVQWTGPWTAPGANPKWAYWHTHWITAWKQGASSYVFDCNGGVMTIDAWTNAIVPLLTQLDKRRDGGWRPTHIWQLVTNEGRQ